MWSSTWWGAFNSNHSGLVRLPGWTQLVSYLSSVLVGFILESKVWNWVPFLNQMEQEPADKGDPVMETDWN
jgi:hypothetical protein